MVAAPAPFESLEAGKYGVIYADPPWNFKVWYAGGWRNRPSGRKFERGTQKHYDLMKNDEITALPVKTVTADDSVLFLWSVWSLMPVALQVIDAWGFKYKTCAFTWIKANVRQADLFRDDADADMMLGYWTRANSEVCLLATRGKPKRLNADVRQGIIEPRRQHSRKPDCVYERIERLVAGPYLELFARTTRAGWASWGNETTKFGEVA